MRYGKQRFNSLCCGAKSHRKLHLKVTPLLHALAHAQSGGHVRLDRQMYTHVYTRPVDVIK